MSVLVSKIRLAATRVGVALGVAMTVALPTGSAVTARAATSLPARLLSERSVDALALKWFAQMQTGQIDRTQLTAEYSAQLSDDAVRGMSRYLKEHDYGAPPLRAEVIQTRTIGTQTLYVVKLVFPRGDAASLMFGFNTEGRITGISLLSMAGD